MRYLPIIFCLVTIACDNDATTDEQSQERDETALESDTSEDQAPQEQAKVIEQLATSKVCNRSPVPCTVNGIYIEPCECTPCSDDSDYTITCGCWLSANIEVDVPIDQASNAYVINEAIGGGLEVQTDLIHHAMCDSYLSHEEVYQKCLDSL
jgi:hypothetical protein